MKKEQIIEQLEDLLHYLHKAEQASSEQATIEKKTYKEMLQTARKESCEYTLALAIEHNEEHHCQIGKSWAYSGIRYRILNLINYIKSNKR